MREKSFGSVLKSQHQACAPSESPSVPSPSTVTAIENSVKDTIAADHPVRKLAMNRTLTDEEQKSFTELQARIKMYNRAIPELRITLPPHRMSAVSYLSLNLQICADYYFKCEGLRFDENAATQIAACLSSLLQEHPLEWRVCAWKNDFIAEIMLGELGCSGDRKKAAEYWLRWYWNREKKQSRDTDLYLSPKRMAASSAVLELEFLLIMDENPELFIRPGFRAHATFVRWLNKHWPVLANKRKGPALVQEMVKKFREKHRDLSFTDSDLGNICEAYESIEQLYDPGTVPASQVVLTLVARKHRVSSRLVTRMRAEQNKLRRSLDARKKARS
jgi:hypothetical protein